MPTVLHVTQPTEAGVAAYVAALCTDQQARGWDVTVACSPDGWLADSLADRGVRRLDWRAERAPGATIPGEARRLGRHVGMLRPDVVHLHSSKAGLVGRLWLRGRLPTIFQPHGWSWLAAPRATRRATIAWECVATRWTSLYICVGDGEADQGRAAGLGGEFCVARTGVDPTWFRRAGEDDRRSARAQLALPAGAPLVVCVGRVTRQKGQDVLLAAWPFVRSRHPGATLAIVGGGELLEPLRRHAPPGVVFLGPVPDVRPWYAAADLVVLPSRWEGLPLTLLEALAVGRSVVGSDIPGIADALPDGAGALVPGGDVVALAGAIDRRLCDLPLAHAEGEVAARYALAASDLRRTFDMIAAATTQLVTAPERRRTPHGRRGRPGDWLNSPTHHEGSSR
jgi:glycosyltransferase involved in cell wall biosynthesis